jgi:hypothetical protein
MTDVCFRAFAAGEADAARHVIDFYGGAGTFDAFPEKVRRYVMATTGINVMDWSTGYGFDAPLDVYRRLDKTVLLVRGLRGHPAMVRISSILAETLPRATLLSIEDGRHFLPATHAARLATLISEHVRAVESAGG